VNHATCALALVLSLAAVAGCGDDAAGTAPAAADPSAAPGTSGVPSMPAAEPATAPGLRVSFKLDRSLTAGVYLGERWVSPATFTVVSSAPEVSVELSVQRLDEQRNASDVSATWTPADPDMLVVSPRDGRVVELTVRRPGWARLHVAHGSESLDLTISAVHAENGIWRADLSQ
jgi:hypothetical protein